MTNAATNFIAQWEVGFVFPIICDGAKVMSPETCVAIPFRCNDDYKRVAVWEIEMLVQGHCYGFLIRDDSGEHFECGCIVGILNRAVRRSDLEEKFQKYKRANSGRILEYFKRVYPDKYDRLK